MGYDVDRFVNFDAERNRELICAICLDILKDSLQTQCGHLFCKECFEQLLQATVECRCPSCNATVTLNDLSPIPRPLKNMINNLDIKCENYERGCGQVIKVEAYKHHLRNCE
ncbi:E3 ubiquitin-protein ligase NRDP1-like protein [Leptotrombidium deliense]|uniref:E3 ubiquitin-protein ligase NRDP1-like protein n=1 Tax=Leptotrombidium deliense TaxID=299467 RepID=A0A443RT08_9ACAR|nr:E3 ubiquitin-protein ligase NRDP1-like protein [Leptotrombidium deliense]